MKNGLQDINLFRYDEVLNETEKGIQLNIRTDHGPRATWLSKKHVTVFRHLNEVAIPEWLCLATKLLPIIEEGNAA